MTYHELWYWRYLSVANRAMMWLAGPLGQDTARWSHQLWLPCLLHRHHGQLQEARDHPTYCGRLQQRSLTLVITGFGIPMVLPNAAADAHKLLRRLSYVKPNLTLRLGELLEKCPSGIYVTFEHTLWYFVALIAFLCSELPLYDIRSSHLHHPLSLQMNLLILIMP